MKGGPVLRSPPLQNLLHCLCTVGDVPFRTDDGSYRSASRLAIHAPAATVVRSPVPGPCQASPQAASDPTFCRTRPGPLEGLTDGYLWSLHGQGNLPLLSLHRRFPNLALLALMKLRLTC